MVVVAVVVSCRDGWFSADAARVGRPLTLKGAAVDLRVHLLIDEIRVISEGASVSRYALLRPPLAAGADLLETGPSFTARA
jgi:hypothetical protein